MTQTIVQAWESRLYLWEEDLQSHMAEGVESGVIKSGVRNLSPHLYTAEAWLLLKLHGSL